MLYICVGEENARAIELCHKYRGMGQPAFLSHWLAAWRHPARRPDLLGHGCAARVHGT